MLQLELGKHPGINRIDPGGRNFESKYWSYATAALGLEQPRMEYSYEFPISRRRAVKALNQLFSHVGVPITLPPCPDREAIFRGWIALCECFAPLFLEKSPHHLHYREALSLIGDFIREHPEIDTKFIGLIRNPMDTLYSMWKRWYAVPERRQFEWLRAYRNLLDFRDEVGERMLLVRYEDIVSDSSGMNRVLGFISADETNSAESTIHSRSVQKWRADRGFGFALDGGVEEFASEYYSPDQMENTASRTWKLRRLFGSPRFRYIVLKGRIYRLMKRARNSMLGSSRDGNHNG
jgi:hypothetical protein